MFKGIIPLEMAPQLNEAVSAMGEVKPPLMKSWRSISNPFSQHIWQVKPPGAWIVLLRFDEHLLTTSVEVPLEVDYASIYEMLESHKSALLCRLDPNLGLIGIAVKDPKSQLLPWIPGLATDEGALEELSEAGSPGDFEGLLLPSIINVEPADSLQNPATRQGWLKTCPQGIWLMNPKDDELTIYEVMT